MSVSYCEKEFSGHHATLETIAKEILTSNKFEFSGVNSWLGKGIYFYLDVMNSKGIDEARRYVLIKKCRKKGERYSIIEAIILCSKVFDLTDNNSNAQEAFNEIFKRVKNKLDKKYSECEGFAENLIYTIIEEEFDVEAILALMDGSTRANYSLKIVRKPQLILCVKKQECIKDIQIVESGVKQ